MLLRNLNIRFALHVFSKTVTITCMWTDGTGEAYSYNRPQAPQFVQVTYFYCNNFNNKHKSYKRFHHFILKETRFTGIQSKERENKCCKFSSSNKF